MRLSPMTVRKWRRRAQRQGRAGLGSQIGRPKSGPLGTSSPELRQTVRQMRSEQPGWGPITLRLELAEDLHFQEHKLPSRSRLAAFLKAGGWTRHYERHSDLVQPAARPGGPARGVGNGCPGVRQIVGVGRVSVINIGDPYSHLRVGSLGCLAKSKADTPDYQLALRRVFLRFGLPARLSLDHDSAFFDNTSGSPFPSRLHLWLIAIGVEVHFITEAGRPSTASSNARTRWSITRPRRAKSSLARRLCSRDSTSGWTS